MYTVRLIKLAKSVDLADKANTFNYLSFFATASIKRKEKGKTLKMIDSDHDNTLW